VPTVAVFGGADPGPEDVLYGEARASAGILASRGCGVVTGGYGGIMEAASRGAGEAGGRVTAVTCSTFGELEPNRWVEDVVPEEDLFTRTRRLIELADAFLVFRGRSGTLSEVSFLWALVRGRQASSKPVALVGESWGRIFRALVAEEVLEGRVRRNTSVHPDGRAAALWLAGRLGLESG